MKTSRYGLVQVLTASKLDLRFIDENEELRMQKSLDRLALGKLTWERFFKTVKDLLIASRLSSHKEGKTLLHLAVLDNRLDVIENLKSQPALKLKRDHLGLNPVDLAQLLNRKEALRSLRTPVEELSSIDLPSLGPFEHLSHPIFETKESFEEVLSIVADAKQGDLIPPEKIWMGIYFDKEIRKGSHSPVSVKYIDSEVGYGVFAEKKIPACSFIGEYTGVILQKKPSQLKKKIHCLRYTTWEGKKNFVIDAEKKGNFTRFINHSSKPNLGIQAVYWHGVPRMIFVSMKEIQEGAQLTFDYGPLYWEEFKQTPKPFDDD